MKTFKLISNAFIGLCCLFATEKGFAQNVGISAASGFTPDASAGLDISYTNKGLLVPRVALTATNAAGPIASPAISLLVYNTATAGTAPNNVMPGYYYWNGVAWTALTTGAATANSSWATTGNTGTTAGTNFIGTTDAKNFIVKTNNTQIADFTSNGNVAIGIDSLDTTNPEKLLVHVGTTNSVNAIVAKGRINNYFQMNIKNLSSGNTATSDIVATADNGTETTNYVDLGINGSGYTGSAIQTGKANDGYLISAGNDFYLVNSTPNKSMLFLTGGTGVAQERMRILANGRVGMGVQDPTSQFVVKDTMEIRRTGPLSQLLFTNTSGSGDLRIAGDGGDLYWQGGGARALQMGSYWTTILGGDRQTSGYPAFVGSLGGTGVLVQSQRDASVPLGVRAFSGTQSANLTEWRNSSGTVLSAITKDGNLGIGNSTPTEKLDVTGNLKFSGALMPNNNPGTSGYFLVSSGAGAAPIWYNATSYINTAAWVLAGNPGTNPATSFIGTTDAQDFVVRTNNAERTRVTSAGNVGIGTATPAQKLDVNGSINAATSIISQGSVFVDAAITNTGTVSPGLILGGVGSGESISSKRTSGTNQYGIDFYAAGASRMSIANGGNVGIGNNVPTEKLDVTGNLKFSGALMPNNNPGTAGYFLQSAGAGAAPLWVSPASSSAWGTTGNTGTTAGTNFIGTTDAVDFVVKTNNTERIRVNSVGDVAIGGTAFNTTSPEQLLVDGGTASSINVISAKGTINNYLQLNVQNKSTGNAASSDVVATNDAGTEANGLNFIDMGVNSSGYSTATSSILNGISNTYLYSSGNDMIIGNSTAAKNLILFTGGTATSNERMRIDGNGNVGIGTTTPANKLSVAGIVAPTADATYNLGTSALRWNNFYYVTASQTSDRRMKTNIKPLKYGLKEVLALKPVSYNWKKTPTTNPRIGLIAQEVKKIVPEVVVGDEKKETLGMNYAELVSVLINAVKEQQKEIDGLKQAVQKLQK